MHEIELKQKEILRLEFEDLLYSDEDFNYTKSEFKEWLADLVYGKLDIPRE